MLRIVIALTIIAFYGCTEKVKESYTNQIEIIPLDLNIPNFLDTSFIENNTVVYANSSFERNYKNNTIIVYDTDTVAQIRLDTLSLNSSLYQYYNNNQDALKSLSRDIQIEQIFTQQDSIILFKGDLEYNIPTLVYLIKKGSVLYKVSAIVNYKFVPFSLEELNGSLVKAP